MAEAGQTDEALALALRAAGRELDYPAAPALAPAVLARLSADRAARFRRPFPGVAIWSRRRVLVVTALGLLVVLALAFGSRFVLGAAEVRVQPGVTPSGPPLAPGALGDLLSMDELRAEAGFAIRLPTGPAPDGAYAVRTNAGVAALLAWDASASAPSLPGTPWGQVLMELPEERELVVKDVNRYDDLRHVAVDGRRAFWIDAPHQLLVFTDEGALSFSIEASVLIWGGDGVTYRLETSLPLAGAIAVAESIG